VIEHISGKKALKVCRIAGQYGKPRSKPTEIGEDGKEIMSFKVRSMAWGQKTSGVLLVQYTGTGCYPIHYARLVRDKDDQVMIT